MTLEDETGPIELRPHHLKRFFYDWMVTSDRDIEDILEKEGYDKTVVMNIYLIREKLFRYDSPIIIVPAEEDSICQGCNKLKDKAPKCIEPDHQRDYYMENLKKLFKEPSLSLGEYIFLVN